MMKKYYIAYGSNLNIVQMKRRCPTAITYGKGIIKDYRLLFKGSKSGSFLTIEKASGYKVPVAVWLVEEEDERRLDIYEGYPTFYYKKEMKINCKVIDTGNVEELDCFVYIMHENRKIGIPSDLYLKVCLDGYQLFGFNPIKIKEAYKHSLEVIKNASKK